MQNNYYKEQILFLQKELAQCKDELKKRDILQVFIAVTYKYDSHLQLFYLHELNKWYDNKPKDAIFFKTKVFFLSYFREKAAFKNAYEQGVEVINYMAQQISSEYGYHFNIAILFVEANDWTGDEGAILQSIFHFEECLKILNKNNSIELGNLYRQNIIYYSLSKCYLALDNANLAYFYNSLSTLKTSEIRHTNKDYTQRNISYTDLRYIFRNALYQETIELADKILSTSQRKIHVKLSHFEYESNLPEHPTSQCFAYIYKAKALSKLANHEEAIRNAGLAYQWYNEQQIDEYNTLRECLKVLSECYEANQEYQKAHHFLKLQTSLVEKNAKELHYFGSLFLQNLYEKHSLVAMHLGSLIDWAIQNTNSPEAKAEAEKICFLIQKNISNSLYGVAQLADDLSITERTLERKTSLYFNSSPSKMIADNKMNAAKFMLRQKAWNISQIAAYVGFSSVSYFGQTFKKATGKTPSEYMSDF